MAASFAALSGAIKITGCHDCAYRKGAIPFATCCHIGGHREYVNQPVMSKTIYTDCPIDEVAMWCSICANNSQATNGECKQCLEQEAPRMYTPVVDIEQRWQGQHPD